MLVKLVKYYLNHEPDTGLSIADDDIVLIVMYTAPHTHTHTQTHTHILKLGHLSGSHKCAINLRSGFLPSGNLTPHLLSTSFTNRSDDA